MSDLPDNYAQNGMPCPIDRYICELEQENARLKEQISASRKCMSKLADAIIDHQNYDAALDYYIDNYVNKYKCTEIVRAE